MPVEDGVTKVIGTIPVAETFGFSNDIRNFKPRKSDLEYGKCASSTYHLICMRRLQPRLGKEKGLKPEIPGETHYQDWSINPDQLEISHFPKNFQ